jgi:glutathione S-transferase
VIDKLLSRLKWVDGELAGKQYLMGDAFSVADPYLFTVANWAPRVGVDISGFATWPRLARALLRGLLFRLP